MTSADGARRERIVVKVGSSSISGDRRGQIEQLVDDLAGLRQRADVILVSSGAIATGMPFLGLESRPEDLPMQQAAAAVGQNVLMNRYQRSLNRFDITAAQLLLTAGDMEIPGHRHNAQNAIERLLQLGILPIVNENDTVATHEIRLGDNDRLAALVAALVGADRLVLLSDVDAIYTAPPGTEGAARVPVVPFGDGLAGITLGPSSSAVGTGGAGTKVEAALLAAQAGTEVLVTATSLFAATLAGADHGTVFAANGAHTADQRAAAHPTHR